MKKRIGILTYHSSINYGAFLQAYSLSKIMARGLNAEVELLNYAPWKVEAFYFLKVLASVGKRVFFKNVKQYQLIKKAQKNLPLSAKVRTNNYEKLCNHLNNHYAAIVIGSDEVLTVGKSRMRPFPNIYWPNELVKIPKLTYAGSANRSNYAKLNSADRSFVSSVLKNYDYVGVRDQHTHEQIQSLDLGLSVHMNCDPCFLVEYKDEYSYALESVKTKLQKITSKPVLAIMTKNNRLGSLVKKAFGDKYFILAVYYPNKAADHFLAGLTPFEWAVSFSLYAGCVTQLFHGTVFSIKNKLPFISIDNNAIYDGRSSKISDLLEKTDLLENYFNLRDTTYSDDQFIEQLRHNLENPQTSKMEKAVKEQTNLYKSFAEKLQDLLDNR